MALTIKFNSPLKGLIPEPEPVINHIPKAYKQLSNSVDSNTVYAFFGCNDIWLHFTYSSRL